MFSASRASVDRGGTASPSHDTVAVENADGAGAFVIACDHASNAVPDRFGDLGLDAETMRRHIAWDPGALGVARALSARLDAPLVAGLVSRLVIDCNRHPQDVDSILAASEDTAVPGNRHLSAPARAIRVREVYDPFHAALETAMADGARALIAIHTFTPVYRGVPRPWHIGILFDRDRRLADILLAVLRRETGLVVGENEPYSPADRVYHTLDRHAQSRGLPNVMIEIRNDLVATPPEQAGWAARLAVALVADIAEGD